MTTSSLDPSPTSAADLFSVVERGDVMAIRNQLNAGIDPNRRIDAGGQQLRRGENGRRPRLHVLEQ